MACNRISKLILLPFFLASLSGCQTENPEISASPTAKADRFDSPDVTVAFLEADGCMVFEDMYFARGEEKDHAFRFKGNEIVEHVTCPKVKFDAKNFGDVIGKPFFEVIQKVGIPSFRGREKDHSVTYYCKDGIERSLCLALNAESKWAVSRIETESANLYLRHTVDADSTYKPSVARCKDIKMGMYLTDVLFELGRPRVFSDSNGIACCWGLPSGGTFHVFDMIEREGSPYFDRTIFERDDFVGQTNVGTVSKPDMRPCYWSVERVSFNERGIEEYPGGEITEGLSQL